MEGYKVAGQCVGARYTILDPQQLGILLRHPMVPLVVVPLFSIWPAHLGLRGQKRAAWKATQGLFTTCG